MTGLLAAVLSLLLVKCTKWGPTMLVVSEERGWGVHLGDLLLLPLWALVAALWWAVRPQASARVRLR